METLAHVTASFSLGKEKVEHARCGCTILVLKVLKVLPATSAAAGHVVGYDVDF
jgi:hypothetical protein